MRGHKLGSSSIPTGSQLDEPLVVAPCTSFVVERLCRVCGACDRIEAVRLFRERRLECFKRFFRQALREQHGTVKLTRWQQPPGRDDGLLGFVLRVRSRTHRSECLSVIAPGMQHPRSRDLPLDIDLFRPIAIIALP